MAKIQNKPKTKRGNPAWKEGVSGNPGGRPKGLGRYIREKLGDDGKAIADFAVAILNHGTDAEADAWIGFSVEFAEKRWAAEFLRDTGFGKPGAMQDEEEAPSTPKPKAVDPRLLTTEQLRALDAVEALADGAAVAPPPTDDVH